MANPTKAWEKAFSSGSKGLQDKLKKVHAKNPEFQSWFKSSGYSEGQSVGQASKTVQQSERSQKLAKQSLAAYGATKGTRMGAEDGSGEQLRDTVQPLTRDQWSKVQTAKREAEKLGKLDTKEKRLQFLKKLAVKPSAPVPAEDFDDEGHEDLRDLHHQLHITSTGSKYSMDEEMKQVTEGFDPDPKDIAAYLISRYGKGKVTMDHVEAYERRRDSNKGIEKDEVMKHVKNMSEEVEQVDEANKSNKSKKNTIARQVAAHAVIGSEVPYDMIHSPLRSGRQIMRNVSSKRAAELYRRLPRLKKEETDPVNEGKMKDIVTDREEAERLLGGPVKLKSQTIGGKGQPKNMRNLTSRLAQRAIRAAMEKELKYNPHYRTEEIEPKDQADVGEYDYEGDMAKSQLRSIIHNAQRMHDMLEENTNLPEWVQSKITLAEDYILTAANYMQGEMNEQVEQIDELVITPKPSGTSTNAEKRALEKANKELLQRTMQTGSIYGDVAAKEAEAENIRKAAAAKRAAEKAAREKAAQDAVANALKKASETAKETGKTVSKIPVVGKRIGAALSAAGLGLTYLTALKTKTQMQPQVGKIEVSPELERPVDMQAAAATTPAAATATSSAQARVREKPGTRRGGEKRPRFALAFPRRISAGTQQKFYQGGAIGSFADLSAFQVPTSAQFAESNENISEAKSNLNALPSVRKNKLARLRASKVVEGLDPVGKEDTDVDNDGTHHTASDKYLLNKRDAVRKAILNKKNKLVKGK